ncbi:AbiU2 domain-containing protein [Bacillus cereus group sp. Bce029]|uniref:AbiU2 domain-containing protein n=1 Tax=Bacillus cereus group sp. Bce029 TaxID=3445239 RepID=UPI004041C404
MTEEQIQGQLLELADEIYQQSFEANTFYEIMMQIEREQVEYFDEIKVSAAFYSYIYNSLVVSTFAVVSKLYDKTTNKDGISVKKLLDRCMEYKKFSTELIVDGPTPEDFFKLKKQEYEQFEENNSLDSLYTQRDKIYSHNTKQAMRNMDKLIEENPLKREQIKQFINFSLELSQGVIVYLTGTLKASSPSNIYDLKYTLNLVRLGNECKEFPE